MAGPAQNLVEFTVSELSNALKRTVEDAYGHVRVRGEISGYTMEKRYFHRDGSIVLVQLAVSLVRDSSGEPQYFIALDDSTDLSLRPRLYVQRPTRPLFDVEARKRS